jgi:hypothetical protein
MPSQSDFYLDCAAQSRREAEETSLPNVREIACRQRQSGSPWQSARNGWRSSANSASSALNHFSRKAHIHEPAISTPRPGPDLVARSG